jgi:hypothetical protein
LLFAIIVDGNVGEGSFGHLEMPIFFHRSVKDRFHPDFEVDGDRRCTDSDYFAIAADHVADLNRFDEGDGFNGDGYDS